MTSFHPVLKSSLAVLVALGWACPSWTGLAQAQGLPKLGKPIEVKAAVDDDTPPYVPGMRLQVVRKDDQKLRGTLVWYDQNKGYLLLREKPGAAPRAIQGKDIGKINPIDVPSKDQGGIRFAKFGDSRIGYVPEIHRVSIINGNLQKVKYIAPTLSTGEQSRLQDLEIAENEMARAEHMMTYAMQSLRDELQAIKENLQYQNQRNQLMTQYLMYAMYPTVGYYNPIYGFGYYFGNGYSGYYPGYASALGQLGYYSGTPNAGKVFETLLTKEVTLGNHLAKSQRTLAQAQTFARYEGERLVAIMTDEIVPAVDKGK